MYAIASRTLTSRITLAIALLAALAIALFAAFVLFAALKVDEAALAKEKFLVRHGLSHRLSAIAHEQETFSVWDEAVLHAAARDSAWLAENFTGWMHRFFGYDRTYVLDPEGRLIFAALGRKVVAPASFADDRRAAGETAARLRESLAGRGGIDRLDVAATDVYQIGGRPAIVSARPILPHSDEITVAEGAEAIFLAIKFLDGATMDEIAHQPLVPDLQYVPAQTFVPQPASIRIASHDGDTIGYLTWNAVRPGEELIKEVAPWAGLALAIALGVGFYLERSLRRASLELHASEGRARHLAFHDALTGLPNRALFEERLDQLLSAVWRREYEAAVLFLDLDRFKNVNDTLGHRAGDQVMRQAAARLKEAVGDSGIVARIGGDEFAVVIADENAREAATRLSETLLERLAQPFRLDEDVAHVGLSIGIAVAPAAGTRREELLRKADIALYEAKKRGRGSFQIFSEAMGDIVRQRRLVEADLRKALAKGDGLRLAYQPLHSSDGVLTGAEALLRWDHPAHQSISAAFLITIAEECGLIMQIGDWVLHEACRMANRVPVPWIAVNVSPVQLRDKDFARRCLDIMAEHAVAPNRIQIEITEAVIIDSLEIASVTLRTLRAAGVRVALDDFGTGYSSMSYLRNFPLDRLKIDRFFIRALDEGEEGEAIVAAMIDMARALKLDVTAEGVETAEQRAILERLGCREMQGFLFSRPVDTAAFTERFFPGSTVLRA